MLVPPVAATGSLSSSDIAVDYGEVEATEERENEERHSHSKNHYHCYCSKERADMGSCAGQNGPPWASRHYTKVMGHPFPEATVQKFVISTSKCWKYVESITI